MINEKNNGRDSRDYYEEEGTVYIFEKYETFDMKVPKNLCANGSGNVRKINKITGIKTYIWQRAPSVFASLTCVSYGLMLGWPSPTYPKFLVPDAPLRISYADMAMVAGFLMLGMCIGTPISSRRTVFGPKYGIVLGNGFIVVGWILMWQAKSKLWLLASRIVLDTGFGFAMGQIKIYIREMCDDSLTIKLIKQINIYIVFGFVMAFAIAPFVQFQTFGFVCMIFSSFVFFVEIFMPPTPRELVEAKKIVEAKRMLIILNPDCDLEEKTRQICEIKTIEPELGFTKIMRHPTLRNNFFKLTTLGFVAQFSGAPATLVFTELFFTNNSVPYVYYVSLLYTVLFFFSNLLGIYESPKYNKKSVLLISSLSVSLCIVLKIIVIFFELNQRHFNYSSVIVMFLFIFSHTIGLGNIPVVLINDFFPKNYRTFMTKYYICLLSMFALISTKVFQVLFFDFSIEKTPFYVFLGVSLFGAVFVAVFIPKEIVPVVENISFFKENIVNSLKENGLNIRIK